MLNDKNTQYIGPDVSNLAAIKESCQGKAWVEVAPENPNFSSIDGMLFSKDNKTLLLIPERRQGEVHIPDGTESIARGAGNGLTLAKLSIPKTIREAQPEKMPMYGPFHGSHIAKAEFRQGLERVPDRLFDGAYIMELVFSGGTKEVGEGAFYGCLNSLRTLELPDGLETIRKHAFSGNAFGKLTFPESMQMVEWSKDEATFGPKVCSVQAARPFNGLIQAISNNPPGKWLWPITMGIGGEKFAMPSTMQAKNGAFDTFFRDWLDGSLNKSAARHLYKDACTASLKQDTALAELILNLDDNDAAKYVKKYAKTTKNRRHSSHHRATQYA